MGDMGEITTYAPVGDRIYTDPQGNILPTVTIPGANSVFQDMDGVWRNRPDTVIAQVIPDGGPFPDNENKG